MCRRAADDDDGDLLGAADGEGGAAFSEYMSGVWKGTKYWLGFGWVPGLVGKIMDPLGKRGGGSGKKGGGKASAPYSDFSTPGGGARRLPRMRRGGGGLHTHAACPHVRMSARRVCICMCGGIAPSA